MSLPDFDSCYRAVSGRDPRFDGWFFTAVRTTGIYCRPSCPALTPKRSNVEFHPSAAAAQRAGFRACKRCRPDASPGSPDWDVRGDLAGRALRLIGDGVIDREGVPGLARRLGYSERQLNRVLTTEVGAGPIALARAQRAQTARVLLETTDLPATDVAFAAGFASVRQFNETVQAVFATTPTGLRAGRRHVGGEPGTLTLRLPYRQPMDLSVTLDFLAARAIPGTESTLPPQPVERGPAATADGGKVAHSGGDRTTMSPRTVPEGPSHAADGGGVGFRRVMSAPGGPARVSVSDGTGAVLCRVELSDNRDLVNVVARVRRWLDLDADPVAVDAAIGTLAAALPGLRSPGTVDGFELAVRAVVGQQVSVPGARTTLGKLVSAYGETVFEAARLFPTADVVAALDPESLPMPRSRGRTLVTLAAAVAAGDLTLDPGVDRPAERARLLALPGIGPWTADYIAMRALGDPDVLLDTDLGVRRSAAALGIDLTDHRPEWAPWRSYATHHLWRAS